MVLVWGVTEYPSPTDNDKVFNYLEASYANYLGQTSHTSSGEWDGYVYRYYAASNAYVGIKNGAVYYLVPSIGSSIGALGPLSEWLAIAQAAGY